ncbi:PucR family transcriptional regulator ligand-binding domain-containing protein [Hoyosella sp. YIM 151337]|uniref:PucR family transcriptional regulator n=1 Tax=Hoyosella sp. YIM 151337 TaxID=2992742 RepID=UPI0022364224|nr:PucR family transcriptional regulator [Hoyosella sp. YIM 151337]MCW4354266.1 PucR family transcriptional regulator ligand-binding domain-containing protein [Hoyosella sp. YIM 151337]
MSERTTPLTLRQLIDEPSLRLGVVQSGGGSEVIRSAHSIEIEDAARWLSPGSLMLTTGLRFADKPHDTRPQERLITELQDAGVVALLFGIGVHFAEVPQGLRDAARARQFPLLTVAADTPFATIEDFVNRGVLAAETYLLKRTVWLQNDLLQSLSAADPVSSLVARLGALCRGTAVLYEGSGRIAASTGHGPLLLMWEEIAARDTSPQRFSVGQWAVTTRPLFLRGTSFWLAIASRSSTVIGDLGPDLLETAERILAAANAVRSLVMSQERAEAVRVISALRQGITTSQIRQTWDRLRPFRFRVGTGLRVVVASPLPGRSDPVDTAQLLEDAQLENLPIVMSDTEDAENPTIGVTAVVAEGAVATAWLEELGRTHLVGVSGPFSDLTVAPQYFNEADTAWKLVQRRRERSADTTIVRLDEVDFAAWLLIRRDDAQVAARLDRTFGALLSAPDLVETIVTYLANDQDVKRTAELLFIHPNTVRYRLRNVEHLVGGSITSAQVVANLYLVFQDDILAHIGR